MKKSKEIKKILLGSYASQNGIVRAVSGLNRSVQGAPAGWLETQLFGVLGMEKRFEVNDRLPEQLLEDVRTYFASTGMLVELQENPEAVASLRRPLIGFPVIFTAEVEGELVLLTAFTGHRPFAYFWLKYKLKRLVADLPGELKEDKTAREDEDEQKPRRNPVRALKNLVQKLFKRKVKREDITED